MFEDSAWSEEEFALPSGDCLVATSDGVTEAANALGVQFESVLPGLLRSAMSEREAPTDLAERIMRGACAWMAARWPP